MHFVLCFYIQNLSYYIFWYLTINVRTTARAPSRSEISPFCRDHIRTRTPKWKTTKEPTLGPKSDDSSENSAPTKEGSMGYLALGDIVINQKEEDWHQFSALEERIKEATWGETWKIRIWGQEDIPEAGEDLLTLNGSSSQLFINL